MRSARLLLAAGALGALACTEAHPPPRVDVVAPRGDAGEPRGRADDACPAVVRIMRAIDDRFGTITEQAAPFSNRRGTVVPPGFQRCEASGYAPSRLEQHTYECAGPDGPGRFDALVWAVDHCLPSGWKRGRSPSGTTTLWEGRPSRPGLERVCEASVVSMEIHLQCGEFEPD